MLSFIWSFLGWEDPKPEPVNIVGVRIPITGPPHMVVLTTTPEDDSIAIHASLFHVPDLRHYWKTERGWRCLDLVRLDLGRQPFTSCSGVYILFYSYSVDDLPINSNVPPILVRDTQSYWGDVFIVKLAPQEWGEHGWALYEDVPAEFLELPIMSSADQSFAERLRVRR